MSGSLEGKGLLVYGGSSVDAESCKMTGNAKSGAVAEAKGSSLTARSCRSLQNPVSGFDQGGNGHMVLTGCTSDGADVSLPAGA